MKIIFNQNICRVNVYEKLEEYNSNFVVTTEKRKIGYRFKIFPRYEEIEGVFYWWDREFYSTIEDFSKKQKRKYVEDKKIYYKPHCVIVTNDGNKEEVFFDTKEELNSYVDKLKSISPYIILE
jgi:hypothetical protein